MSAKKVKPKGTTKPAKKVSKEPAAAKPLSRPKFTKPKDTFERKRHGRVNAMETPDRRVAEFSFTLPVARKEGS